MKRRALLLIFLLLIFTISSFMASVQAVTSYNIYGGESASAAGRVGFGNNATIMTIPGPTMTFTTGETVTVTFHNSGYADHNWVIVDPNDYYTALWGAQIGTPENPIKSQSNGSVTFTVGNPGNYTYISQCLGIGGQDFIRGMHGNVVVQPAIPEFPATILVSFMAVALTSLAVYLKRKSMHTSNQKAIFGIQDPKKPV